MDKKLAKENIGTSRKLLANLKQGKFKNARHDIRKIQNNLNYIKTEISSGKARKEHKQQKTHHAIKRSSNLRIRFPRVMI